ncbi:MAG: flippase-like domain-containing protein [Prevotella sp.]|nr:flippase-like domain-containing protein [Prevotella sp.]
MTLRTLTTNTVKVVFPLLLGGAILYWMYRDFDFSQVSSVMLHDMDWTWMLLSLPFGVTAQLFRGLRWCQTLEPIGEHARRSTSVNAVFLSYATSLVIPRVGEFLRCGVLKRHDGVTFAKSLGTVVTERAVDSIMVLLVTTLTLLSQLPVFHNFFVTTGTRLDTFLGQFTTTGYLVTLVCLVAALLLLWWLAHALRLSHKLRDIVSNLWQGVVSLRNVSNVPLYLFYTVGIWVSYFLHFYLTFYCFEATSGLGINCALVSFVVGSIAVIVPTPNGAGPWHFSVKTMLILYGVESNAALYFVLIVHTVQTMLVVLLGVWAWASLSLTKPIGRTS